MVNLQPPFPVTAKTAPKFQQFCEENEFLVGITVSMEDSLTDARLSLVCKPKPQPDEDTHCKGFATGYVVKYVEKVGIISLKLHCA